VASVTAEVQELKRAFDVHLDATVRSIRNLCAARTKALDAQADTLSVSSDQLAATLAMVEAAAPASLSDAACSDPAAQCLSLARVYSSVQLLQPMVAATTRFAGFAAPPTVRVQSTLSQLLCTSMHQSFEDTFVGSINGRCVKVEGPGKCSHSPLSLGCALQTDNPIMFDCAKI
jgi:hypothetical protein